MKYLVFTLVVLFCISVDDSSVVEYEMNQYLSYLEISNIIGGCGSGKCTDYTPSCSADCITMSASNCQGSAGSCVHNFYTILCDCPTRYIIDDGCM